MKRILHIGPAKHGIADYDLQIDAIYRLQGYEVEPVLVSGDTDVAELAERLAGQTEALYHFEIGAGGSKLFQLSRTLLARDSQHQLVTLHDPGVLVWHPLYIPGTESSLAPVRFAAKAVRKLVNQLVGQSILDSYVNDPRIHRIYLRPDLAGSPRTSYLPQPTYHDTRPAGPAELTPPLRVGFGGFWGPGKGLETLIEAVRLAKESDGPEFALVLGGGTADADDAYAKTLRQAATAADPKVELAGFVADDELDGFLQSLAVLVLPYWPELPNGTSAMAMRAAELAVPVIASDTPALKVQLGADGAVFVKPKDAEALRVAIVALATDPKPYVARARQTQEHIFEGHNWSVVGQDLHDIVTEVEQARS